MSSTCGFHRRRCASTSTSGLLAPERELPEVVITTRHGRTLVEPGALARRLGGRAQVVLVETGEATYALRDVLGDELAVWGGAARVYHPGFALTDRASQHPRIYAFEGRESEAERGLLAALGSGGRARGGPLRGRRGHRGRGRVARLAHRHARASRRLRARARGAISRAASCTPATTSCASASTCAPRARAGARRHAVARPAAVPGRRARDDRRAGRPGRRRARAGAAAQQQRLPGGAAARVRTRSCRSQHCPPELARRSATTCWPRASCASTSPTAASSSRSPTRRRARRARGRCACIPTAPRSCAATRSRRSARSASSTAARGS